MIKAKCFIKCYEQMLPNIVEKYMLGVKHYTRNVSFRNDFRYQLHMLPLVDL